MDSAAWSRFVSIYHRALLAFVEARYEADSNDAQEVVQMVFVRCVKSMRTFDPKRGSLLSWLKTIASNEAHTLHRRDVRRPRTEALDEGKAGLAFEAVDSAPLPDEILESKEVRGLVLETLSELPDQYAQTLLMKYSQGMTAREIAEATGVKEDAAAALVYRARDAFRRAFLGHSRRAGFGGEVVP